MAPASAAIGGMLGMGSGLLIVPALTVFWNIDIHSAIGASIVSVIACSCASAAPDLEGRLTNVRIAIVIEVATTLSALTGAMLSGLVPVSWLFLIFAIVLALSAGQMLMRRMDTTHAGPSTARKDWAEAYLSATYLALLWQKCDFRDSPRGRCVINREPALMEAMEEDWQRDLEHWLEPYLQDLGNKTRRRMCPAYIAGLIGPGDRKSIQPMAARADALSYNRLHHSIGAGLWDSAPLEARLWRQADALVGGDKAWLIIDDTALPKKGKASVGVAPQYATVLGKNANCQTLVSLTLASRKSRSCSVCDCSCPKAGPTMPPGWQGPACPSHSGRVEPGPTSPSRR